MAEDRVGRRQGGVGRGRRVRVEEGGVELG